MIPLHFDQPVLLHFPNFFRKRTPVHAEIVSELLAVEGDGDLRRSGEQFLIGKIGEQPFTDGFRCGVQDPAGKLQVIGTSRNKI